MLRVGMAVLDMGVSGLSRASFVVAGAAIFAIVGLYVMEIALRYFLNAPTVWSLEVIGFLLCVSIFSAIPEITRRRGHVAIDFLISYAGEPLRRIIGVLIPLLSAVVTLLAALIVLDQSVTQLTRGVMTNAAYPIPKGLLTAVVAYGLGLSGIVFLAHAISVSARAAEPDAALDVQK